jgi:hypothetical protein
LPTATLRPAPKLKFPTNSDSNSPAHWDGDRFFIFNSLHHPSRSLGKSVKDLGETKEITYHNTANGGRWIEATWQAEDGTLYGWYHIEPLGLVPGTNLTAPKIGALVSKDNGETWKDLGVMLEARNDPLKVAAKNGYFAGGHGDFSVMLDDQQKYLYFYLSNYTGAVNEQGVAVARMEWKHRNRPVGRVWKWHQGEWKEPGVGGSLTPIFPAYTAWERADCDSLWGPSVHWNAYLGQYVMLINRSRGHGWKQEGTYISYSRDLTDPKGWSEPQKLIDGGTWYPQVIGGAALKGTDKLAGKVARFFMHGVSDYEIVFTRPDAKPYAKL